MAQGRVGAARLGFGLRGLLMKGRRADVVVLGAGVAGLACATALAEKGAKVAVLEKKPHAGGRVFSFRDPQSGEVVDNGQHLFMGCYWETRRFLKRIGTEPLLRLPKGLRVDYAGMDGATDSLRCPSFLPAPLHLAAGILGLGSLTFADKMSLRRFDRYARARLLGSARPDGLDRITVREWFNGLKLSPRLQAKLLDPITIGVLNELPERASALGMAQALKEIFYGRAEGSRLGFPKCGLSELFEPSIAYLEKRGGRVLFNQKVSALEGGGVLTGVFTERGERFVGDSYVSALPPWALARLPRPGTIAGAWEKFDGVPIIGINLWLDRRVVKRPLTGLWDAKIHWVFDKTSLLGRKEDGQYLSLVISGARAEVKLSPKELFDLAREDLSRCFPEFKKAKIVRWSVVKEPQATPSPVCGSDAWRPAHRSPIANFYYAGDWTQTGLPATIESAAVSGHACAKLILERKPAEV